MKSEANEITPASRKAGLLVEELSGEVLVYDLTRHKVHCLNPTAARVWKRLDGKSSIADIARSLAREYGFPIDNEVVWFAIKALSNANLLEERIKPSCCGLQLSRRELAQKLGLGALLLPVITTITAPVAQAAVSCTPGAQGCIPVGGSCSSNLACCSCRCIGSTCQP